MTDTDTLIKAAQQGDADALSSLLDSHYDTIYRFAYRWCTHQANAEDIAQQACIKLARHIGQFRFDSSFTTWLYRLVINCAKDWQRKERLHLVTDSEQEAASSFEAHEDGIYLTQVLTLLDDLGEGMKETALLVHAEGFTHAEAAQVLGVKETTISWRIHEMRKQLSLLQPQKEVKQ